MNSVKTLNAPILLFYSYSHKDETYREELEKHLMTLQRSGLISGWHDRKILAGDEWDKKISEYLEKSYVIMLLISSDFVASKYCYDIEATRALERYNKGEAILIPIILRPVKWELTPFGKIQALPKNAQPVTQWADRDSAYLNICEGILALLTSVKSEQKDSTTENKYDNQKIKPLFAPVEHITSEKVLDAALPEQVTVGKTIALVVMIRGKDSEGLKRILRINTQYGVGEEDVISTGEFPLEFSTDEAGKALPLELNIKIESPDFEHKAQTKSISILPDGDSEPRIFLLTPKTTGDLFVNLELYSGDDFISGSFLSTKSLQTAPLNVSTNLLTIPIGAEINNKFASETINNNSSEMDLNGEKFKNAKESSFLGKLFNSIMQRGAIVASFSIFFISIGIFSYQLFSTQTLSINEREIFSITNFVTAVLLIGSFSLVFISVYKWIKTPRYKTMSDSKIPANEKNVGSVDSKTLIVEQAMEIKKQIKFAVVMYGGGSLAIYINGVAQELLSLTQATADGAVNPLETTAIYRKIALFMANEELQTKCTNGSLSREEINERLNGKLADSPSVKFVIDVLTGSSAGGINAVFLAKAMVNGAANMDDLQRLWLEQGDFGRLLNDKKSVADNNLDAPLEPASLLNSQRMYLELLKALDGLDKKAVENAPKVEPLDLFITYTDFAGLPTNLVLADKTVLELTHKRVFNFRNEGDTKDFEKENNPFLAFAARCTSSFPVAFEPMRLEDIDEVIECAPPGYEDGKSDNPNWLKYFGSAADENGKPVEWEKRSFVDGGCLDNKPFGYAVEKLTQRSDDGIVERKLLYIEPAPEDFQKAKRQKKKPDALENLFGQASGLPRYETIREDLRRVLDRNRLIERVARLTREVESDFEKNPGWFTAAPKSAGEKKDEKINWATADLNNVAQSKGAAFIPYYRLRVSATTDDIARLVTKYFKIDDDSDYFKVLRLLIRVWREANFHEYREFEDDTQTFNNFLYQYDVEYRLRRLRFVLQKAEFMLRGKTELIGKIKNFAVTHKKTDSDYEKMHPAAAQMITEEKGVLSEYAALLVALPGIDETAKKAVAANFDGAEFVRAVSVIQNGLNRIYGQLKRDNDFMRGNLSNSNLVDEEPKDENLAAVFSGLKNFRLNLHEIVKKLSTLERSKDPSAQESSDKKAEKISEADQTAKLALSALGRILSTITDRRRSDAKTFDAENVEVLNADYSEGEVKSLRESLDRTAETLSKEIYNNEVSFLRRASLQAKTLLGIKESQPSKDRKPKTETVTASKIKTLADEATFDNSSAEAQFAQNYLRNYYELFDSYDQISFPIYFESPVGEAVRVEVVRISSRDAHSLINEECPDENRRKLAGDYLMNFGAFLDARWRLNDIMWGRLDGAERLITTLLPDEKFKGLRDLLISEANQTILRKILVSRANQGLQGAVVNALTFAATESVELISGRKDGSETFNKFLADLKTTDFNPKFATALTNALNDDAVRGYFAADYEVDRNLEPHPTLQTISRATQIGGKILQDIAEKQTQAGNRLSWIARLGQVFWGLVTVAAPNSLANLLFLYWVKLLFLFEVVVIAGATLLAQPNVQQFGIVAFVITLVIYLSVTALHDEMLGSGAWKRWVRFLLGATLTIFVLGGVGLLYGLFVDDHVWKRLTDFRAFMSYDDLVIWQKLFLLAPFLVVTLLAVLWREIEKQNLKAVGTAIVAGFLTIIGLSAYFARLTTGSFFGKGPLIKFEFVKDGAAVNKIIADLSATSDLCPNGCLTGMRTALWVDTLAFVPLYLAFLLILCGLLGRRREKWAFPAAVTAAVCAVAAAIADWTENYYSLVALEPGTIINDQTTAAIRYPALIKWTFVFVAVAILASIFFRLKGELKWNAVRVALLIMAVFGLYGTYFFPSEILSLPAVTLALISIFSIWGLIGFAFLFKRVRENFRRSY